MAPQDVVVHFEIALAILQMAGGSAASGKGAGHLQAGCGRERYIAGVLPGKADVGLVQKRRAQREDIGQPQVLLADRAVVTGFGEHQAAAAHVVGVVYVGGVGGGQHVFGLSCQSVRTLPIHKRCGAETFSLSGVSSPSLLSTTAFTTLNS
jgi:hypothetical protein